jgi:hypothetical protein
VNFELLNSLAQTHRDELMREAAAWRSLRGSHRRPALRARLARAVRALGYLAVTLGDALAERP